MADIRIKDLPTTASLTASDDFIAIDGTTNGTRKLSAAAPSFLTSVTTPSLTSPASTNLTLGTTDSGAAITVLSESNNVGIGTTAPGYKLDVQISSANYPATTVANFANTNATNGNMNLLVSGYSAETDLAYGVSNRVGSGMQMQNKDATNGNYEALGFVNASGATTAGIFGINVTHGGAGVAEGALQFLTRNTSGGVNAMRIDKNGNVGIGTTTPGSTLTLATVDTLLKPALGLRQANALGYGYDFDTETASVGRLDLYRVSNNVRTQMMSWRQDTGNVTIASTTAGSSGAGALVVQGGISAGNTGAASYFGGAVTVTGTLRATNGNLYTYGESGNATDGILFFNSAANNYIYGTGSQLAIYTAGVQRATISSTGATFAGTVSPQQATTAAAPAYVKGAIYFDTTLNKLRVGGATAYETITSV